MVVVAYRSSVPNDDDDDEDDLFISAAGWTQQSTYRNPPKARGLPHSIIAAAKTVTV